MPHLRRTPLHGEHLKSQARMIDFVGWDMPLQYEGLRQEHHSVRTAVGLFDVSHMGEIRMRGKGALKTVEWVTTNYVAVLESGQAQYSLLPNENGGIIDDLIVYCLEKGVDYLLCVNAVNTAKDLHWIVKNHRGADVIDESSNWGQIAVQGPNALELMSRVYPGVHLSALSAFQFLKVDREGGEHLIARTGYTGESGCEIFVPWNQTALLWSTLIKKGGDLGVRPIGLGARDSLRTEMKYSLYGHEIDEASNPYSAELGWVVKPKCKDFIGREAMLRAKKVGLPQKLVGFKLTERGIPRQGYRLFSFDNNEIGRVTSGTLSPTLGESIGIAYVDKSFSEVGTEFAVEIRNKKVRAVVVKTPFVQARGV